MNRKHFLAGVAAALSLMALLWVRPTQATTQEKNGDAKPPAAEVRVDNFSFSPETLTVPVNTTVTWVNKDDVPHVIASNDGRFKSRALDTDDRYSYTFTKPGSYPYYCTVHPKMVGKIVVR